MEKKITEEKALLSVKEMCAYLSIGQTKCRELLSNPDNGFTIRIGNRLYAHKKHLDKQITLNLYCHVTEDTLFEEMMKFESNGVVILDAHGRWFSRKRNYLILI